MQRQKTVVNGQHVACFDPDRLFVFRRQASLCQGVQRIAVTSHDLFRLLHLLLERGIVGREPVIAIPCLDQKDLFAVPCSKALNDFLG